MHMTFVSFKKSKPTQSYERKTLPAYLYQSFATMPLNELEIFQYNQQHFDYSNETDVIMLSYQKIFSFIRDYQHKCEIFKLNI